MKIAIGLSGGVDSSVAAHLLKEEGHEVIGVFMRFWHDDNPSCSGCVENKCCNEESFRKVQRLCIKLDIPLKVFDFQNEFKKAVVDKFVQYYTQGKTPNPCVWCNEEIKFKLFYEKAKQDLDIDFIATGHYADIICHPTSSCHPEFKCHPRNDDCHPEFKCHPRNDDCHPEFKCHPRNDDCHPEFKCHPRNGSESANAPLSGISSATIKKHYYIKKAKDQSKDQSYFLYRIPQDILSKIKFPLANLDKSEVKKIAQQQFPDLNFDKQKESQDLCFVSSDYKQFVSRQDKTLTKPGDITDEKGETIGQHNGLINYTIGQRKGITEGGGTIYYAKRIDTKNNKLIVAPHSQLLCDTIIINNIIITPILFHQNKCCHPEPRIESDLSDEIPSDSGSHNKKNNVSAKIRYNTFPAVCNIIYSPPNPGSPEIVEENSGVERGGVPEGRGGITIKFNVPQFAPTPGQHCVFYLDDIIIGGGEIA